MKKFFGTPDGIHVGQFFHDRKELSEANVHRPTQPGISGNRLEGADSIVLSGGYEDEDYGDYIVYSGQGGRAPGARAHTFDQSFEAWGNAGLITSRIQRLPVRVTRGHQVRSPYAPPVGYVYAGLYEVNEYWMSRGRDGFDIVRFKLDRIPEQTPLVTRILPLADPAYSTTIVSRRIRDTALSREVKKMYRDKCQVCGIVIPGIGERQYSEGAHVRPLGRPHLGLDASDNILCLCPNHHTQLDFGGMVILDDYTLAHTSDLKPFADLSFVSGHSIQAANVKYQREFWVAA